MLALNHGPESVAVTALCRAVDASGDYWTARGRADLHVLDTLFIDAAATHYRDEARMRADGFSGEEHFDRFTGAVLALQVHLPDFPIIRYKGGGFTCSSPP